jgi:DNA-binding GntR family transcriptional regulator
MVMCRVGATLESRHALIIEALRKGDATAARQVMLNEVDETRETIIESVIQENGSSWHLKVPE